MQKIKIETIINSDINTVWEDWNNPESIKGWAFASDTWECTYAENDLKVGGRFLTRMSSKDKTVSFDFTGTYVEVDNFHKIKYIMDKDEEAGLHRECETVFTDLGNNTTKVEQEFDPEDENSIDIQKAGWKTILENFKKFVEGR